MTIYTRESVHARFIDDTSDHKLTVLHDDGLYRHLYFGEPGTGIYSLNVLTAPGILVVYGDMGSFTFQREPDMLPMFHKNTTNEDYWGEKMTSSSDHMQHSGELAERIIVEYVNDFLGSVAEDRKGYYVDLLDSVRADVLCDSESNDLLRTNMDNFVYGSFGFTDTQDWSFDTYTYRYLWVLRGINTVARGYYKQKAAQDA